jgi:REP element-mobilizing transposase RayT
MVTIYNVEFFTGTILKWQKLFSNEECKQIVLDSLQWLVNAKRCRIFGFVIMPNHVHILWRISDGFSRAEVQTAFFSFTAHKLQKWLRINDDKLLENYCVNDVDRKYQFWEEAMQLRSVGQRSS